MILFVQGDDPVTDVDGLAKLVLRKAARWRGRGSQNRFRAPGDVDCFISRLGGHMTFTRITVNPNQMGGVPCIRGLRIPVATVVGMVADGMTAAEVLKALPDLEPGDITEALHYAAEAVRERELPVSPAR